VSKHNKGSREQSTYATSARSQGADVDCAALDQVSTQLHSPTEFDLFHLHLNALVSDMGSLPLILLTQGYVGLL